MIIKDIDKYIIDNNITKIYLDFDGVISHTCQAIVNILNKKNKTNFNGTDDIYDFSDVFVCNNYYKGNDIPFERYKSGNIEKAMDILLDKK